MATTLPCNRRPLALALGAAAALVLAACSSSPAAPVAKVATGTVTCSAITGAVSFSPPLTTKGGSAETSSINVTSTGCTPSGSNVTSVTKGVGTATLSNTSNNCTGLLNAQPLTITIRWSPSTIKPTVVKFSSYAVTEVSGGKGAFDLPGTKGTASVTGSFAGSDGGAGSTSVAVSNETATQLLAGCGSSAGLVSIPVASGTLTLK